jgi:Mrp family chromosome partitioning ATPase
LNTQLAVARAERARTEGKLQMARGNNGNSLPDVLVSQTIQELRNQLSRAEVKLKESPRLYLQPDLQVTIDAFRKQLDAETGRIITSLAHDVAAAQARETSLAASLERLQADYGQASAGMTHLSELQREADASRTIYETFLARFKQTIEHEGLAVPDALLITEAQAPANPAFPKKLPFMLIAGLVGTLIGGVAAAVSERLDDRIRDVRQIDAIAGVPVLGILPNLGRVGRLGADDGQMRDSHSQLSVALQWLRMAVLMARTPCQVQVVLVTSATPADGKTSLCLSLAREFGSAGERTLVIDADPYRPRIAVTSSGTAKPGQDLDFNTGDSVQDFVQVDARSRMHFIAVPRPNEFQRSLRSGSFARVLMSARNDYDTIILNVAPVLTSADAATLAKLADLRLFVVRCGRTSWGHMLSALSSFRLCGSPVDGIVIVNAGRRELYRYGTDQAVWERPNPILVEQGAGA